ncbi:MAG: lipid A biosynthesis acyltransferase [Gammaproteobacteria bacterium]|nr:lipid A biosynthesis acyltransferase [Gammaproteobacteria bacterium]
MNRRPMADVSLRHFRHPRYWPTWIGLGFMRVVSWLPLPLIAAVGGALGMLLYALHAGRRRVVQVNVRLCFPELSPGAQARVARKHFRAFGQTLLDIGISWWASESRLKRLTRFRGHEYYEQALRENKSIILLVPHFVGLETGGMRLSIDRPMVTVFRHPVNKLVSAVMGRARARFQMQLVEHNKPLTAVVRQVKAGSPLYYLPDQDAGLRQSVFAPFFGVPAATFVVLPRLAKMTDAVVIPCITRQLPQGRGYEIEFRLPLKNFPTGDAVADTTRMNREIEAAVREMPEQYFWLHKRFKTRPKGEKNFYS